MCVRGAAQRPVESAPPFAAVERAACSRWRRREAKEILTGESGTRPVGGAACRPDGLGGGRRAGLLPGPARDLEVRGDRARPAIVDDDVCEMAGSAPPSKLPVMLVQHVDGTRDGRSWVGFAGARRDDAQGLHHETVNVCLLLGHGYEQS